MPLDQLPRSESLKDVLERLFPYWNERIAPEVLHGKAILISAHGNSCWALLKYLEGISDEEIINVTLPTGVPILLELDENLHSVGPHQFLGDQEAIQAAIKKADDQEKVKQADKLSLSHMLARNSCRRSGMRCVMGAHLTFFFFVSPPDFSRSRLWG